MAAHFSSKSGMIAVSVRGARNQPLQKVVSWISSAERSPTAARPAERQGLALENAGLRIVGRKDRRHVAHAQRMVPPQRLHRHGNVFAPVGGRARRTGEQRHPTRSRDAPHALHHPFDIGLEGLVVESLHLRLEPLHRTDMPQVVAVAELREASPAQQLPEHPRLRLDRTAAKTVDGPLALREPGFENYVSKRHDALQFRIVNSEL